jgi:circadian clock protein KaiC
MPNSESSVARVPSGLPGLDEILHGGFPPRHTYLVHGQPGSGKTTLGMQFSMEGARRGEKALYVTNCETVGQIEFMARGHEWSLEGVDVHYLDTNEILGEESEQSLFHVNEVAFPRTLDTLVKMVDEARPDRLVLDSLTELRLLAAEPRAFRRELLSLTRFLTEIGCTSLLFDDASADVSTLASVVNGLVDLQQVPRDYGPDRRRLRVRKLRGTDFRSGYHDFRIERGGIRVFPRIEQDGRGDEVADDLLRSGVAGLDELIGDGIVRGSSVLFRGTTGGGKSTLAAQFAVAAAERGEASTICVFDESRRMLLKRTESLGIDVRGHVDEGRIGLLEIDPAELTPGEFSHRIQREVAERDIRLLVIDSLNGYVHAMTDERMLLVHLHELLSHLGSRGVTVLLVLAEHGGFGAPAAALEDLSYISDAVFYFRHFEHAGEVRRCISVYKNRGSGHEHTIRELRIGPRGVRVGEPLRNFRGVLGGAPEYVSDHIPEPEDHGDERT